MSFSSDLKTELSKINNLKNKDEVFAEFLGYLVTNNITQKGKLLKFSTENTTLIDLQNCYGICKFRIIRLKL